MNAFDVLQSRGFVYQCTDEAALRAMLERPTVYYTGFDPTADSLTAGHLVPIMQMAWLQRCGHVPIVLCGGGTALVGDPTGKTESRPIMTRETITANVEAQRRQLTSFLRFGDGVGYVVDNADWLCELNYVEFLRDYGMHFSVNQMLTAEIYRTRLESGQHLSFLEFNYQLLQAYDFLHLHRKFGCTLQCSGSDQWANCLAGRELIRRLEGADVQVSCAPLLTTASGAKMGKSEAGAVWLDAARTSPYDFYQYWINCEDGDIAAWLRLFTFLDLDEIEALCAVTGAELRGAKRRLAHEVTALVHGEEAAAAAAEAAAALFGGDGSAEGVPTTTIPVARLELGLRVVDLLVETGLCASLGEAKRLLRGGGAYVNDVAVESVEQELGPDHLSDGALLLRAGKKRYHRVLVG